MDYQNQIAEKVRALVGYLLVYDDRPLTNELTFREDLGADSLDMAELIVMLGRNFDINIFDHEVAGITTLGEAISYIQRQSTVGENQADAESANLQSLVTNDTLTMGLSRVAA